MRITPLAWIVGGLVHDRTIADAQCGCDSVTPAQLADVSTRTSISQSYRTGPVCDQSRLTQRVVAAAIGIAVLIASTLTLSIPLAPTAAATSSWESNGGGWHGSGSAFIPGGGHIGGSSGSSSGDGGGTWTVVPICPANPGPQSPCGMAPSQGCPNGSFRYAVFAGAAADQKFFNNACIGPGERPISEAEMSSMVRDRVQQVAPPLRPGFQPANGALTQLPTVFRSGQAKSLSRTDSIAGFSVRLRATASWRWVWGDRTSSTTTRPGGKYPDMSVSHTYRRAGMFRAQVITSWTASYFVDGGGPYAVIGGPVTQLGSLPVPVRQSRAVLVEDS